jgi:glycine/D-amino acid oxidase-like deaminating enzyme
VGVVAAGHTSVVMARAGLRMPLESFPLQALVSEPVKPVFPCVVMSNTVHAYISQSDKGELVIGAGTDQYISYSQQGGCTSPRTRWRRSASCSRSSGASGCCATGAASSTSRPTARPSSA